MRTNLVQTCKTSANRINLNRTAMRVALIGLFISLGIGNAWGESTYYSTMKVAVASGQTGYGTVYVNAAGTTSQTQNSKSKESSVTHSYNIVATANPGYKFSSWSGSGITFGNTASASTTGSISTSSTSSPGTSKTATASFVVVQVSAVDNTSIDLGPTNPSADYPFTVRFTTVNKKNLNDFTTTPAATDGKFSVTWSEDGNDVIASGKFNGGGSYGGASRNNSTTVSLQSKASGSTAKTCTVTANFPAMAFVSSSATEVFATQGESGKTGSATFTYNYGAEDDFPTAPTLTPVSGSGIFSVTGYTVTPNFSAGTCTVTVDYEFDTNNGVGDTEATLTLTAANGDARSVTIVGHSEALATNDASVTPAGGSPTEYATFAQALAAANGLTGATLTLLRNIDLGTITATNNITKAITIDLNGKELRAAVNATQVGVLTINANVAVTIKDSKTGGRIINEHSKNAVLYTINVAQGTLNLESGTISIHNTLQQSYGTAATGGVATSIVAMGARAIQQAAATTVNINGGRVESYGTRAVYGIRTEGSKANNTTLNISGGEVYAEAPAYVYAVFSNGKLNVSGGTITAKINNGAVNENTAYMEYIRTNNKLWDNRSYGLRGFGYGILLQGGNSVTATSNYFGTLNMTGGTVNVINVGDPEMQAKSTATDFIQSPLYGVYFNAAALNVKTGTASDGSYSQKYAAKGSITGGTISVTNSGRQSYGVYVMGHYNSFDNTSAPVVVKNCTINVSSYYESYGVYANATIGTTSDNASPNMGACYAGEVELTGATVTAETTTAAMAYALFAHAVVGNVYKNATWTKAKNAGYTQVYDGEYAAAAKITVNSGTYTATSATTTAYAVASTTRAKTVWSSETSTAANKTLGGNAEAYPVLILHGGTFRGQTGTTTSGAVFSGGHTTIDGGTYTAYSGTTTSRGIYATAGTLDVSNVEISASGTTTAYGIDLSCAISDYTGFKYYADATLKNLTVTATTRTGNEADAVLIEVTKRPLSTTTYNALSSSNKTSYGSIYQYGEYAVGAKCSIIGGTYTATAQGANAFGVSVNSASLCEDVNGDGVLAIGEGDLTISNAKFTVSTKTGATAYGVWAGGKTSISNSTFNVTSATSTAYGLRAYYGKSTIKNSIFDVTATTETALGLRAEARMSTVYTSNYPHTTNFSGVEGYELVGEIETEENTVTVRANGGNTAYGVQVISAKGTGTKTTADAGLAFKGDHACAGNAVINGGKYTATASGTTAYAIIVSAPATQGAETAIPSCTVNDGKFYGYATGGTYADLSPAGEPGYFVLNGGYYVKDENIDVKLGEGMNKVEVKSGTPEYTEGYRWRVTDNMTGEIVCKVWKNTTLQKSFQSLEEALQYVGTNASSSNQLTIEMVGNYTLASGDYELPKYSTLLVPYQTDQKKAIGTSPTWKNVSNYTYVKPTPFVKLTFASGVNMTVSGTIETSAVTYVSNTSLTSIGTGVVAGKYGLLELSEGSHIDLESGATIQAWGYITGKGEINAKNGSTIYEDFQIGDWRGGTMESSVKGNTNGLNSKGVFLITHYYYQNIEAPVIYRPGAAAKAYGGCYMKYIGDAVTEEPVTMVGTNDAMFLMNTATAGEDTWVRKEYDPTTDYVNWTMNSGASLGSITLDVYVTVNSADYVLPITSNFNIIANYGNISITNDVCFIPGSRLIIKKEGTVTIPSNVRAFFYDYDDWSSYGGKFFKPYYSPSWSTNPRTSVTDAFVQVEGTLNLQGVAYTTAGGANIHSTRENAGKVIFGSAAPASTDAITTSFTGNGGKNKTLCQLIGDGSTPTYNGKALNSIWLKNEDGNYSQTTGTTSNKTWIYMEDDDHVYRWILSYEDGCFTYKNNGGGEKQLIHPSDWVAAVANANGDHAYHSEDGTRMFVNAKAATTSSSCVWWEVDPTPQVIGGTTYYVANNENFDNFGTYFYWENSISYWVPKKVKVIWKDKDGNKITNGSFGDDYNFNTSPVFHGTNPTWANTTTEKHDWIGWRDEEGNIYDKNATLPRATADVTTYTAYFVTSPYQYTVTFKNKTTSEGGDGKVIWSGLMNASTDSTLCPVTPTQDMTADKVYTFSHWTGYEGKDSLPPVTGSATYTAEYTYTTRTYTVTFYNYDGVEVLQQTQVAYGSNPVYAGIDPYRANTSAYSYAWTGWKQGTNTYGTTATLPTVTGDIYYIATFEQTELQYQVFFKRPDGTVIDAGFYAYNATPAAFPANPTMESTVSTDYTFTGNWSPATLQPVTEDGMTYTALFDESVRQYTAHFVNYDGASLNADQTIDYNTVPAYTGAEPIKPNDSRNSYEFSGWAWAAGDGWEAGSIGVGEAFPAIKGDITFTAQYTPTLLQFDVIYQREDGFVILRDKKKYGESSAFPTTYTGATSGLDYEDESYSYTFDHWSPATVVNPVEKDATYTAYFNQSIKTYSISNFGISPAGYGTVSPASLASIPGGSAVTVNGNKITVNGTTITATPAAATAQYTYAFDHWNNVPATVTGNISDIEAVFTRTVKQYDVTFNMKGHGAAISSQTKDYGSKVDQPADPYEAGYTFVGWYKEDACTNAWNFASDEVTGATTLFAKWTINQYTITFDTDGGSAVASITQNYGTAVTPPANPTRTGYTFAGWLPEVPATMPVDGETCVAQWTINSYQIKFVDEDGTTNLGSYPQTLDYGAVVTAPEEPAKAADATNVYTFAGWSDGVSTYASADIPAVSGAVTYTATYNSAPTVASVTVGGAATYYATLQAAFDYAANKTTPTITMLQSVTDITTPLTYTNSSNTTVTFELNGKTVSGGVTSKTYLLYITGNNSGLFKIQDSAGDGKISNTMSKNAAHYCVYVYNCPTELRSGTIYMENKNTSSSVQAFGVNVRGSRKFEMKGGTIEVKSSKNAHAIYSSGTTNISAGTLIATETKNGYASGVHVINGKTTITGTPTFTISGTKYVNGVRVGGLKPALNSKKTAVTQYNGTADIQGGTYIVTASSNTAYGVLCYRDTLALSYADNATCPGNYAGAGKVTISGGEFTVSSTGATAYGICTQSAYTVTSAKAADGVTLLSSNTVTPKTTITGGKFNVSGSSSVGAVNTSATADNLLVQGGWYNISTNLSTKYTAPTKDCNYHVLPLTDEDPYKYEVAEAYTITFKNGETTMQEGPVKKGTMPVYSGEEPSKAADEQYTYAFTGWDHALVAVTEAATYTATFSSTPRTYTVTLNLNGGTINAGDVIEYTYGTGATLPTDVTKDGHEFGGWFDNSGLTGDAVTTISTTATGNKEYWAKWTQNIADRELDIVDWTSNSITINVTNLKAVGGTNKNNWKIYANGSDYTRNDCSTTARTLTISGLSLTPNENLLIQLKNDADVIESQHNYKIPQIYTANATLSGTNEESVVYVYGGKLTISDDITLAALYVCPGAEVEVTDGNTLTVGKLVLRTKPWATAAISGNVTATNVYYTRIAPDGSASYPTGKYYQFGLPYECDINDVRLSDGTTPAYNTTWILKSYNEERRAASGTSTNNWDALAADATIEAGRGYEMFSSYKYYREYYFPVTPTDNTLVSVTRHGDDKNNSGWNIVCSPLMNVYHNESDPVDGLKVSWLLADGSYDQAWPEVIWPAMPFSYQASANGYLDFSSGEFNQTASSAPRRAAYKENIQTEWIHLDVKDGNGVGDHTSVFVHPDRFEATYETGIDVAKQSLTASRAILYSSHAYGDMAFAGVSDSLLEKGVALTVYSPKEQELTISMRNNNRLNRLAAVWLIDYEKGMTTDLLWNDYTFDAVSGTMSGRFIIQGAFFAPGVTTDLDNIQGDNIQNTKARKVIIDQKMYIQINGRLYDANGKLLKTEH